MSTAVHCSHVARPRHPVAASVRGTGSAGPRRRHVTAVGPEGVAWGGSGGEAWGGPPRIVSCMSTFSWRPIQQLNADWAACSRTDASRRALERLAEVEPVIAALRTHDLGELVAVVAGTGPGRAGDRLRPEEAGAVVSAMLRSEEAHPLVARAIVQAILPGLVGVARRLSWGSGGEWPDAGAFFSDLVTTAWEVVVEWSGQTRPYAAPDLLSAARCRLRRQLLRYRGRADRPTRARDHDAAADRGVVHSDRSDLEELAYAIDAQWGRGDGGDDGAVLYAHRVLGYSLAELSRLTGHSRRYLGERRDRAAEALIA